MKPDLSNLEKATLCWGDPVPEWVRLLAIAADKTGQKTAGAAIGRSGGYVSRVLRNDYPASYAEAEQLVSARFGNAEIICPEFGPIPKASCLRNRRRTGKPGNFLERRFALACPDCPLNPDIKEPS